MSISWTKIRHFKAEEFVHPELLRWEMLEKLEELRNLCGFPLIITSSYRDPAHNAAVGGVQDSAHLPDPGDGKYSGIDIATGPIGPSGLYMLIKRIYAVGFVRWFGYPNHVHVDIETRLPQQVCRFYPKD